MICEYCEEVLDEEEKHQREIDAWVAVWLTGNKKYAKKEKQNGNKKNNITAQKRL
jgi:hypothetical protein